MQYHAIPCNTMQYNAIPCNTMQYHAIPCTTMQYHAIGCKSMQYHAIPCIINNCLMSVPLPCGQYKAIFGLHIARIIADLSGKVVRLLRWLELSIKGDNGCALSRFSPKKLNLRKKKISISFCLQIFYSVSQEGRVKEGLGSKRGDHKVGTLTTNTSPC